MRHATFVLAAGLLTAPALATTTYDNQADFYANAGALFIEDFESYAPGDPSGGALPSIDFGLFEATSTPDALKILQGPLFGNHNTTPGGSKYLSLDTDVGFVSADLTLVFDDPITEFGIYIIDAEDGGFVTVGGSSYSITGGPDGVERYFGIIADTPFNSVRIDMGDTDSHWSVDDVAFTIPAPSTFALLLTGVAAVRRRAV
jgi:hypothetical protein